MSTLPVALTTNPAFSDLKMPASNADRDEMWAYLNAGIDHVMNTIQNDTPSAMCHSAIYTTVFNYGTSKYLTKSGPNSNPNLIGDNLYRNLERYFIMYLKTILQEATTVSGVNLLEYYTSEWDRYVKGANYLNRVFAYLNRHWIKPMRDEGRKYVFPVYTLMLSKWKEEFLMILPDQDHGLSSTILRMIAEQRSGEVIDENLLRKVLNSFVSLGIDASNLDNVCFDVYRDQFEVRFIKATVAYYEKESNHFLAKKSVLYYLKKLEKWLQDEEHRAEKYLHATTRNKLITACENVLIRKHEEAICKSLPNQLDCDRYNKLHRMYNILSRVPECLESMRNMFELHVKSAGLTAILTLVHEGGANVDSIDGKSYVTALLDVHQKYSETVNRSFKGFEPNLDKACRDFINFNAITELSTTKSSEIIVKYADMIQRQKKATAEVDINLEATLDRVMILFKYLEAKDVFQAFYATNICQL